MKVESAGFSPAARSVQIGNNIYHVGAVLLSSVCWSCLLSARATSTPTGSANMDTATAGLHLGVYFQSGGWDPPDPLAEHQ